MGWHLAIGNYYLETGQIIRGDQFSWTMPGYFWGNSYFAYQILVAFLISNLGFLVTVFTFGIIGSIGVLVLLPKKVNFISVLLTILGCLIALNNLGIRPHTISFLLFAILIRILAANFFWRRKYFWFWFLFFALWANFHNAYLIGLFALGSFRFIDYLWGRANRDPQPLSRGSLIIAQNPRNPQDKSHGFFAQNKKKTHLTDFFINCAAAFAGTFLTPFTGYLWLAILNDAFFPKMYMHIAEWLSIAFFNEMSIIYSLSGIIFILIVWKNFIKLGPSMMFISAFFFMIPVVAVYFAFFWSALFIFLGCRYFVSNPLKRQVQFMVKLPIYLGVFCLFLAIVVIFISGFLTSGSLEGVFKTGNYPVGALDFMNKNNLVTNVFNQYEWGGFIDWRYPNIKVFVDGRMTGWHKGGRSMLSDYLEIHKGNCQVASMYKIETLVVNKVADKKCFGDFEKVYEDKAAEVWTRKAKGE